MSDAVIADGGAGAAEAPAVPPLAEVPAVETPSAPAPEVTTTSAPEPVPAEPDVEIEMPEKQEPAPQAPAPTPAPAPEAVVSSTAIPSAPPPPPDTSIKGRLNQALEALKFRKRAKLDKILQLAAKKKSIKNDDVEKLLKVSDSTAQRYLKQLVQEGRLTAIKRGNDAWYEPR